MKVFGICGSPRNNTTYYVLKEALDKLNNHGFETGLFSCFGKDIGPCMHCDYCLEHKKCISHDDMLEVYEKLQQCDGLILATPVQSGGISSNLSAIMDRTRALEAVDYNILRGKIGMSIAVGGDRTGGQDFAHLKNITYFMIHGIIPVSGGPFGSNLGASFWSRDSIEDIKKDNYGFESLNRTLAEFEKFLQTFPDGSMEKLAFEMLYWTGMRAGELIGLFLKDFDLDKGIVSINKSAYVENGRTFFTRTKTISSNRVIDIPQFLVNDIENYLNILKCKNPEIQIFDTSVAKLSYLI